jgi:hypothetical protein
MEVPLFLDTLEQSGFSRWFRETQSFFGYYFVLTFHTIGLSLIVGPNTAIDLRLLGIAREIPIPPLKRLFGLMWFGLLLNVLSGVFLVIAYPVKSLTNPVFYLKLVLVGLAVWVLQKIKRAVFEDPAATDEILMANGRTLAIVSLALWVGVLTTGRLLAYTCNYLLSGVPC